MGASRKRGLRTGYTTGTCAAAAAKAAVIALTLRRPVRAVEVSLPGGGKAELQIETCAYAGAEARSCVIKDAGDDPDVTHGAEICAAVRWVARPGIAIGGGEGVGVVTKPGLGLDVGTPAINPVPMKMITVSVQEALGRQLGDRGIEVVISVPRGAEIAKKTLNERLGIVGGISILGTTGIVRPFSTSAYKACIAQAMDVALASGCAQVVLTTGGRTEAFAQRILSLPEEAFIQMADFVGFALRQSAARGIREVAIVAMIGKLSKIAAGVFQTHARHSRVDSDLLAGVASECGLSPEFVSLTREGNTARHFSETLPPDKAEQVFLRLCELASERCHEYSGRRTAVECILVGFDGQVLARARAGG